MRKSREIRKTLSEYCWLSIYPGPGQESDQAASKHRTPPMLPYPEGCLQPCSPARVLQGNDFHCISSESPDPTGA